MSEPGAVYYKCRRCGDRWAHQPSQVVAEPYICKPCWAKIKGDAAPESIDISGYVETVKSDMVNHPDHYKWLPVEVIEITEHLNFTMGNAVKYILRADHKGKPVEDLKKAIWYLERELHRRGEKVERFAPPF